jgi:Cdc6-like AAA superfamily ATPase
MMSNLDAQLISIQKAFINFTLRAEKSDEATLVDTFVNSAPLLDLLSTANSQIIYGRRGTGKTHAIKYVSDLVANKGEVPIYVDLRSVGSNTSIYNDLSRSLASRAAQLINDVLEAMLMSLYPIALNSLDRHPHPDQVTVRLDDFQQALASVRISGTPGRRA